MKDQPRDVAIVISPHLKSLNLLAKGFGKRLLLVTAIRLGLNDHRQRDGEQKKKTSHETTSANVPVLSANVSISMPADCAMSEPKVGHWDFVEATMLSCFNGSAKTARSHDWQIVVIVNGSVTHSATKCYQRVVKQTAVSI